MWKTTIVFAALALTISTAIAQLDDRQEISPRIISPAPNWSQQGRERGTYLEPRPAAGPYDKPTLGSPAPRRYGKEPTLGDPRPYRNTNPRTCTGLLCD